MTIRNDQPVVQALAAVAKLGGFSIKRVATADDLKTKVLTIAFERISDGEVQDHFDFDEQHVVAKVNERGEVESINGSGPLDPSDYTEKDETLAQAADPDEGEEPAEAPASEGIAELVDGEPEKPHLVGELAAAARKRR